MAVAAQAGNATMVVSLNAWVENPPYRCLRRNDRDYDYSVRGLSS